MFGEPLLAHAAEIGGVHATRHPHPREDADRDQHDADADDEKHRVVAASSRRIAILTRGQVTVCALVHRAIGHAVAYVCTREQRGPTPEPTLEICELLRSNRS